MNVSSVPHTEQILTCKINKPTKRAQGSVLDRGSQSRSLAYLGFLHLQRGSWQGWSMATPRGQPLGRRFCMSHSDPLSLTAVPSDLVLIQELYARKGISRGQRGTGCGKRSRDPACLFVWAFLLISDISDCFRNVQTQPCFVSQLPFGQNAFPLEPVWQPLLEPQGSQVWEMKSQRYCFSQLDLGGPQVSSSPGFL